MARLRRLALGLFLAGASIVLPARAADVDVALLLAIDISASVDAEEYRLQMAGLAAALQHDDVIKAIAIGEHKRIAVSVTQWSGVKAQYVIAPWTIIDGRDAAAALALRMLLAHRADDGGATSLSAALAHGRLHFRSAPAATRKVIDVSADGRNNIGPDMALTRRAMLDGDITINGLAIENEWPKLSDYLEADVIGGPGAFVETAKSYDDFGAVMLRKLVREIIGPGTT